MSTDENDDLASDPLFQIAGMFASDDPGWVDRHDEYLVEEYANQHTNTYSIVELQTGL